MSERDERVEELERRVEELRGVNERLGRQLVAAEAGRHPAGATPAARVVAKLVGERDRAEALLAELRPELERLRWENPRLEAEVTRLRSGYLGLLRRVRGRITAG